MKISSLLRDKSLVNKIFPFSNVYDYHAINPANNTFIKQFNTINSSKTEEIIEKSVVAAKSYSKVPLDGRIRMFFSLKANLEKNIDLLAKTMALEMGKPILQGKGEINKCIGHIDYYIKNTEQYLKDKEIEFGDFKNKITYKPIGPILSINPWNFPFWVPFKSIIPSMFAGNTIILKPAPCIPESSLLMEKMFTDSGFSNGEFQVAFSSNDDVEKLLIPDMRIREIIFTGSTRAGSVIAGQAGRHLKKTLMELGGNDPFIVLPDADLDKAAIFGAEGRLRNTGQACICAKRMFVHSKVYDQYMDKLITEVKKYKIGDPLNPENSLGPIARFDLFLGLKKQVLHTLENGARIVYGNFEDIDCNYHINDGNYFKPLILENITKDACAYNEELFGPVFSVFKFDNIDEMLEIVNDSEYGLGASIFTKDIDLANSIAERIDTGMVFINSSTMSDSRLPYGGSKNSGYGRTSASSALQEFTDNKLVSIRKL